MNNLEEVVHLLITAAILFGVVYVGYLAVEAVAMKIMSFI